MKPNQYTVAMSLLQKGDIFVVLDPSRPGVILPEKLMGQESVSLNIGHNMPIPIPDLLLTEIGFAATLSFGGVPFTVTVPWWAVYCVYDRNRRGQQWPEQMPASVRAQYDAAEAAKPVAKVISLAEWRANRTKVGTKSPQGAA